MLDGTDHALFAPPFFHPLPPGREGEAICRAMLRCDWVKLDLSGSGTTRKP
jgi:hypothetical protein